MSDYVLKVSDELPDSPARTRPAERPPLRLGLVQQRWHADPLQHERMLTEGIVMAAEHGARIVCLQELTLSPYFAITPDGAEALDVAPEPLEDGQTVTFARKAAAESGAYVHASLYEQADRGDGLGFNTAVLVSPRGELVQRTRKLHIPITAGYYEDKYFRQGPASGEGDPFPVVQLGDSDAQLGLPTCWDQWFPELARAYSLAGAEVLIYPTAIGSEPDHPGVRHRAAVAAGDRRQRHCQRHVHGRRQPLRRRGPADVLRLELHLGSVRPHPRPGAARPAGGAGGRPRPGSAP